VCASTSAQTVTLSGASLGVAATTSWNIISGPVGVTLSDPNPTDPSLASISVPANATGIVELELTGTDASSSCSDLASLTVTVNELPSVSVPADFTVCANLVAIQGGFVGGTSVGGSATEGQWTASANPATTVTLSNTGFVADPSVVDISVPAAYIGDITITLTSNDPLSCGAASESFVVSLVGSSAATTWTGAFDDNWHVPDNWTNCVPGPTTVTTIAATANNPRITDANGDCFNIEIQNGAQVEITGSLRLNVYE